MKKYFIREIERGEKLTDMQDRINKAAACGMIGIEDKAELDKLLLAKANPGENRPDMYAMLLALEERVKTLEEKNGITIQPEQDETNPTKYETWQPWDGINDKYQMGAIVYHPGTGKLWKSTFAGQNTWEPGTIGTEALWREYVA